MSIFNKYSAFDKYIDDNFLCTSKDNKIYDDIKSFYETEIINDALIENCRYLHGIGWYYLDIKQDYDKMKKYFSMAIEKGDTPSMCCLGKYYECIEKNYDKMMQYYEMASKKGDTEGTHCIGEYYGYEEKVL